MSADQAGGPLLGNPLRDPRDRRIPRVAEPCVLVMFGVTGDLARKKLLPAIYDLANRGLLPPGFSLVGFARRDWLDQDFAKLTYDAVREHARTRFRDEVWEQVREGIRFVSGEFSDDAACDVPTAPNKPAATSVTAAAADSSHLLRDRRGDRERDGRRDVSANKNGRGIRLVAVIGRPSSGGSLCAWRVTVRSAQAS